MLLQNAVAFPQSISATSGLNETTVGAVDLINPTGLQYPFDLLPETNITAIKYFNNTFRHLGQMAQWTGLMIYDTDPY